MPDPVSSEPHGHMSKPDRDGPGFDMPMAYGKDYLPSSWSRRAASWSESAKVPLEVLSDE